MTTLLHERGTLGFALAATLDVAVRKLITLAKERNVTDPVLLDRIAREWVELQALKYTNYRSLTTLDEDRHPGARRLGVEARVVGGNQRLTKLALEILGSHAQLTNGGGHPTGTGSTSSCARAATRSRPAPARSSATSSPSACSACRGADRWISRSARNRTISAARRARSSRRTRRRRWSSSPSSAGSASCSGDDFTFLDAAVLFEELGRCSTTGRSC